jgi:hypothetical protein
MNVNEPIHAPKFVLMYLSKKHITCCNIVHYVHYLVDYLTINNQMHNRST